MTIDREPSTLKPRVSLVICTRNRPVLLAETLASIAAGDHVPSELIIIDQSDAHTPPAPPYPAGTPCELRYLHSRTRGLAAARNEGIHAARHPVVVFTDDDMNMDPGWLGALHAALVQRGERAVVTGRVLPHGEERPGTFVPSIRAAVEPGEYVGRVRTDPLTGGSMAAYREALEEMGGFDARLGAGTRYPSAEDADLGHRFLEAGFTIAYVPEAIIFHRAWRRSDEFVPLRWGYGLGQGAFLAKHARLRDPYTIRRFLGTVVRVTLRAATRLRRAAPVPGRRVPPSSLALGDLAFATGVAVGFGRWLVRERRTMQAGRYVPQARS